MNNLELLRYKKKIKILEKKLKKLKQKQQLEDNLSKKSISREIQSYIEDNFQSPKSSNFSPILEDIHKNLSKSPSGHRYSNETYSLSLLLQKSSPTAYDTVAPRLLLPSRQSIYKKYNAQINDIQQKLLNIENVLIIVKEYRQLIHLPSLIHLNCILAVDAICFKPFVSIASNGNINGIQINSEKKSNLFQKFSLNPRKFEKFIQKNFNNSYSVGFAYQLQPLFNEFKNIVVHIQPAISGKASTKQIETLHYIREILKNVHITVKGYAFDGDNTYHTLHSKYFNYYIHMLINSNHICETIKCHLRIISDPLHILKRVRYRLLSGKQIIIGFQTENSVIDLNLLQSQLIQCPSIVFNNSKITKMHDSLPLTLFSMTSLKRLFELRNIGALAYFTPWCLFISAMESEDLDVNRAFDFISIALYYLMYYYLSYQKNYQSISYLASENKTNSKSMIIMFDKKLLIESINSLYSILAFLCTENHEINTGRIGSTPLEHTFGKARIKAKYRHTLDNLTRCISIDQLINDVKIVNDVKIW